MWETHRERHGERGKQRAREQSARRLPGGPVWTTRAHFRASRRRFGLISTLGTYMAPSDRHPFTPPSRRLSLLQVEGPRDRPASLGGRLRFPRGIQRLGCRVERMGAGAPHPVACFGRLGDQGCLARRASLFPGLSPLLLPPAPSTSTHFPFSSPLGSVRRSAEASMSRSAAPRLRGPPLGWRPSWTPTARAAAVCSSQDA